MKKKILSAIMMVGAFSMISTGVIAHGKTIKEVRNENLIVTDKVEDFNISPIKITAGVTREIADIDIVTISDVDAYIVSSSYEGVKSGTIVYATTKLNIRSDSSTDSRVIGNYYRGDEIVVISDNGNGWYEVENNERRGYVYADYTATERPYVDESEVDLLAHVLYAEAGASHIDDTTLYYVGSVVLNRVNSSRYPNTLREVIYQKGQYACTTNGALRKTPTERCYRIARDLLGYGSVLPAGVLGQAAKSIYDRYGKGLYDVRHGQYFFYL